MKTFWLKKNALGNLIILFNGWGADRETFSDLNSVKYDVLSIFDYENENLEKIDISNYSKIFLLAHSMGVFMASKILDENIKFERKIAINGTLCPINDTFGIKQKVWNLTKNNFNTASYEAFNLRAGSKYFSLKNPQKLKEELFNIENYKPKNLIKYDFAYISKEDKIFPFKNQIAFWENENCPYKIINGAHFPNFTSFDEIFTGAKDV